MLSPNSQFPLLTLDGWAGLHSAQLVQNHTNAHSDRRPCDSLTLRPSSPLRNLLDLLDLLDQKTTMSALWSFVIASSFVLSLFWYLSYINRRLSETPPEILMRAGKPWTRDAILTAYEKYRNAEPDFVKYLPTKQNRRYIVVGGSGQCFSRR